MSNTIATVDVGGTGVTTSTGSGSNVLNTNPTFSGGISTPNTFGFKNTLINGAMNINQRGGYAGTPTPGTTYYNLDRWWVGVGSGSTALSVQQTSTSGLANFPNCTIVQRNSGQTNTSNIYFGQQIESSNLYQLQGQTVTISFWAKAGANFSAASSTLTCYINTGTTADQYSWGSLGGWTGFALTTAFNSSITTSWVKYTGTVTIPSGALEAAVVFTWAPTGTAGTTDAFYITGAQLELGSQATPFDVRPIGTELALCQRYYWQLTSSNAPYTLIGVNGGSNNIFGSLFFPVTMRAGPTGTFYNGGASPATLFSFSSAGGTQTSYTPTVANVQTSTSGYRFYTTTPALSGQAGLICWFDIGGPGNTGYLTFNAEL